MNRPCCSNRNDCLIIAVAASILIGIVTAILSATEIITLTPAFLWALLGVAVVYLLVTFVASSLRRFDTPYCAKSLITAFIVGILGTILFSVLLLGLPIATASPAGVIFSGLLLASFALIVTSVSCLILNSYTND